MMVFNSLYGFVFKKSWFDYFYLWAFYAVVLHWMFLNGECWITYAYKKMKDKNYQAGDRVAENEIQPLLNVSDGTYRQIIAAHFFLVGISIYLVAKRNKIPLVLCFVFYFLTLANGFALSGLDRKGYEAMKEFIKYALIAFGLVCLWLFNRRVHFV